MSTSSDRGADAPIAASVVVLSGQLTSAELQQMIGLAGDRTWKKGDPTGPTARGRHPYNGWRMDIRDDGMDAESALTMILARVRDVADRVRTVATDQRVHSVSVWVFSSAAHFGIELKPDVLEALAALGASLKINAYGVRGDPDVGGGDADGGTRLQPGDQQDARGASAP